jgi:DNA mismatch repair protein MutS
MTYTPVSSAELASWTPMMRQYFEIKQRCPDHILFFRMGDFYEIFGDDAIEVAPKLELVLTSREKGDKTKIPFCEYPIIVLKTTFQSF